MTPVATFLKLLSLLLVGSAAAVTVEQSIKVDKDVGKQYLVAPELFRDSSFAFASIDKSSDPQKEINVTLRIVGRDSSNDLKCNLVLKVDDDAKSIGLNSLRRLSENKVLLVGYEEPQNGERHAMTITFDLQICESTHLFSTSIVPEFDQIVTRLSSDEFTAFVPSYHGNSSLSCPNDRRRVILDERLQLSDCFDVDLLWSGIKVERLYSWIDRFIVRGFDAINGTYKALDYDAKDHPRQRPELISLPDATNQTQFVSDGEVLCYLIKPGEDRWVHCLVFVEHANTYIKIVAFDEPVTIVAVSYSLYPQQELLLVGEKAKCEGTDCRYIVVSSNSLSTDETKKYSLKLRCDRKSRSLIGAKRMSTEGAITVEYVCDNDNELVFHTISLGALRGFNNL